MGPLAITPSPIRWRLLLALAGVLTMTVAAATPASKPPPVVASPAAVPRMRPLPAPPATEPGCGRSSGGLTLLVLKPECDPYFQRVVAPTL